MKKTASASSSAQLSAPIARAAGGLPKTAKAVPVAPKKVAPAPAAAAPPPRPAPSNVDEMKTELMLCVQESKFKEALRWSVNILKLEPSNAIMSEYQPLLAALAVRSTMKAQSSSDDGSSQSDNGSSSSESESSSGNESDSDGEGEGDKENVDAVQTKLQGMSVKPLSGS